jgi:hypothetical protein
MQLQFHKSNTQMHIRLMSISLKCIFVAHCLVLYVRTCMVQKCNIWQNTLPWHEAVNNGGPELMNHVNMNIGKSTVYWKNSTTTLLYTTNKIVSYVNTVVCIHVFWVTNRCVLSFLFSSFNDCCRWKSDKNSDTVISNCNCC